MYQYTCPKECTVLGMMQVLPQCWYCMLSGMSMPYYTQMLYPIKPRSDDTKLKDYVKWCEFLRKENNSEDKQHIEQSNPVNQCRMIR